jgi:hypothetical protein
MRARRNIHSTLVLITFIGSAVMAAGCYEDLSPDAPQAQQQPQAPAAQNPGPITSMGNQGNSALGGAKRAAENTIDRAQQKSREVADEAGDLANDG